MYYLGHGRRDTGDWCFQDGFITFSDIAELYSRCLRGRVLTIVTDCSHSGAWVNAWLDYLDRKGVQPCGHSAKDKGIFIKLYASCRPEENASTNCFVTRAVTNDRTSGKLSYCTITTLSKSQHSYGVDTTAVRCKRSIEDECALRPEFTWRRWRDGNSGRLFIRCKKTFALQRWYYVLLDDDPEKIREYKRLVQDQGRENTINLASFGTILKSGWGRNPPPRVINEMDRRYHTGL